MRELSGEYYIYIVGSGMWLNPSAYFQSATNLSSSADHIVFLISKHEFFRAASLINEKRSIIYCLLFSNYFSGEMRRVTRFTLRAVNNSENRYFGDTCRMVLNALKFECLPMIRNRTHASLSM